MGRRQTDRGEYCLPAVPWLRLGLTSLLLATAVSSPLYAHGFGQRYDLPIPLWLYLLGAGATVGFSFLLVAALMPARRSGDRRLRLALPSGGIVGRSFVLAVRVAGITLFALVVIAGLIGNQSPFKNIAPTMVWVIGWVGLSFASALIGDIWVVVNPWDSLARLVERHHQRGNPPRSSSALPLSMQWLDAWPAVILFLLFAWCELIWDGSDQPRSVALALLGYSAVTWAGMLIFGRPQWLRRGEIFSIAFGLFSRFAPLEAVADGEGTRLFLRPYAAGLLSRDPASPALTCFVLLLLATVTFDGILETPNWAALAAWIEPRGVDSATLATLGLVGLPLAFLGIYLVTIALILQLVRSSKSVGELAGWFITTFVPIALAYDVAHNLSFLALGAQYLIPILSDPLGIGWDLFGTKLYLIDTGVVTASMMWYVAIAVIVGGHVVAVYLAHTQALRLFPDRAEALRSQTPLVVLMIAYTMTSLWILAQPITNIRP
ncbi:MAG: hypothetical protein WAK67_02545 [Xanthobacteraceae bacterium]